MKVCIGITTKNRKAVVAKAIESALSQDYSDCEVFVFDDGSIDGTSDLREKYPTVRWERSEESVGLLAGRNRLMSSCNADIYVSLDDDAWFLKNDEIQITVDYFKKNEKLGIIAYDILEKGTYKFREVPRTDPFLTNMYIGCGHALRLDAAAEAGYYKPFPLRYGHEEKDLAIQILDLGFEMLFLPGVHVWHDHTPVERNSFEQDEGFVINDLIFKFRRVPFIFVLPVVGVSILRTLQNQVRRMDKPGKAVRSFIKLIPSELKRVKRVKISTYLKYRKLSKVLLAYQKANKQS